MNHRRGLPFDLSALVSAPVVMLATVVCLDPLFRVFCWLRHPAPYAWLWTFGIAATTAVLGAALLFLAKLPQYRAGIFFRISGAASGQTAGLYLASYWLIIPSVATLLALLYAAGQLQ